MRATAAVSVAASLTLVLAATGLRSPAAGAATPAAATPRAATAEHLASDAHVAEVRRIRAHFDSVLVELERRDVAGLPASAAARRQGLLATLRAYRDRGAFPHNYDFDAPTPYFVDRETGVLCAVAHLLASTGRRDIVDRVARADNNVWVPQLANDTAFTAWLDRSGLTLAEAARIQVPYVGDDPTPGVSARRGSTLDAGSAVALGGALAASYVNLRPNAQGGSRLGTVLGFTAGVAAVGLGSAGLAEGRANPTLAAGNVLAGAASAWLSTRGLLRHRRLAAAQRGATPSHVGDETRDGREAPQASVSPLVSLDGRGGAGLAVSLRF